MTVLVKFEAAKRALAEARSIDEVKLVRDQAEALRLYVRQQGDSLEMQNDIAEIKLRAERRAGELLAAGGRKPGETDKTIMSHNVTLSPTLEDLGISRMQASRWQLEANVPEEIFECHVAEIKAAKEELTSVGLRRLAKRLEGKVPAPSYSTGENEWYTPKEIIEAARVVMGEIELDPASTAQANTIIKAQRFYSPEDDGLAQDWRGKVWMNPPYAQPLVGQFADKLAHHVRAGDVSEAIILVNNATETKWFFKLIGVASAICFPQGRVKFWAPDGSVSAPLQGQAIIYIGKNVNAFTEEFGRFGWLAGILKKS